jgi:hypothetical protein
MMKLLEPERIYSTRQLLEALQSGLAGLKEQLQVPLPHQHHTKRQHMEQRFCSSF